MDTRTLTLLGILTLGLAACGEQPKVAGPAPAPVAQAPTPTVARSAPYRVLPPQPSWGAIEGMVTLGRALPIPRIVATKDLAELSWRERDSDILAFDPDRLTLADAVVFLRAIEAGKDWPEPLRGVAPAIPLTLRDGMWSPHVQWSRRYATVALTNAQSKVDVNVAARLRPWDEPTAWHMQLNVMLSPGSTLGGSDEGVLRHTGHYQLQGDCCFDWSIAHVLIFDHPYVVGPTALDGAFALESVPPGTYELVAWHGPVRMEQPLEGLTRFLGGPLRTSQQVTVAAGSRLRVELTLPP